MKPIGLSITEAGKALGGEGNPLSRSTIYRLIGKGHLEAFRLGRRTLITTESLETCAGNAPRLGAYS